MIDARLCEELELAVVCDTSGSILEVFRGGEKKARAGVALHDIAAEDQQTVVRAFLSEVAVRRAAFGWRIGVEASDGSRVELRVAGGEHDGKIIVVASPVQQRLGDLYAEVLDSIGVADRSGSSLTDQQLWEELSMLNNELATAQRELAKKSVELERLNEEKNRFLGMAAHDLRNPLGVITTYSGLLIQQLMGKVTEEQMEFLADIRKSSRYMANLINDLLDVTAIEAGKIDLRLATTPLRTVVQDALDRVGVMSRHKEIDITVTETADVSVVADRDKLAQVFENLLSNAVKFSRRGRSVVVEISQEDQHGVVRVIDEGVGIPQNELAELWRPFERTSVRSTEGERSTGLGLAIVDRLVYAHRGRVTVESQVGTGTTFSVFLPLKSAPSMA